MWAPFTLTTPVHIYSFNSGPLFLFTYFKEKTMCYIMHISDYFNNWEFGICTGVIWFLEKRNGSLSFSDKMGKRTRLYSSRTLTPKRSWLSLPAIDKEIIWKPLLYHPPLRLQVFSDIFIERKKKSYMSSKSGVQ